MATTITMPQLGETVTEGTVAQWLKQPGDAIEKYEAFVEVSTDKVNAEVPSPVSGVLREIIAKEGETVPTGAPIAIIDEVGASAAPLPTFGNGSSPASATASSASEILRGVSPAVRRLAREHQIDVAAVRGSGANGRVTADDILAAAGGARATEEEVRPASVPARTPAKNGASAKADGKSTYASPLPGTTIPLTQARKLIAERMVESLANAPHAWTMVEVDVSQVVAWRTHEKERFLREYRYPLTLLAFFLHAVVQGLKAHPLLNASYTAEGIVVHRTYNIGVAVAANSNLLVPVIRDADTLSIGGLALAAGKIVEKARTGKLGADDLSGATFTVNNTGANGSILSKPILGAGQAGIVTMEAVVKRPVVVNDAIAIRSIMNVCLSLDHRVIDGAIANAFLSGLKTRLEGMGPLGDL